MFKGIVECSSGKTGLLIPRLEDPQHFIFSSTDGIKEAPKAESAEEEKAPVDDFSEHGLPGDYFDQ